MKPETAGTQGVSQQKVAKAVFKEPYQVPHRYGDSMMKV